VARTLDDVAAIVGVSRATVSRVINGGSVSPATRDRVLSVLQDTGFRPNIAARTLASGRSGVVGVVMHVDPHALFGDPYFSAMLQGLTDGLAERASGMMVWLGNRTKEQTLEHILGMRLLDGVIVTANTLDDPLVDGLLASPLATVLIGHRRADRTASYVDVDHAGGAENVTGHLLDIGRTRIGHISGRRGTVAGEERIAGYLRALAHAGLDGAGLVVDGDFSEASGVGGATELVRRGVDAMFCANDATAAGAIRALHGEGLRVPEDVAVAGFDDLAFAERLDPPLTTIRQGVREQGAEAARILFDLVRDPERTPRRVVLPTELIVRGSTVATRADRFDRTNEHVSEYRSKQRRG
jgi:DNA-binding LacI/PurR family transcriptional regulator